MTATKAAEVLAAHQRWAAWSCICGERFGHGTSSEVRDAALAAHQAEALAAAGLLADPDAAARLRALYDQAVRDEIAALGEAGAAERERDALAARIAAVEALHRPDDHGPGRCDESDCPTGCTACDDDWPCATVRALTGEEGA